MDVGQYNLDPDRYQALVRELYDKNPPITLPPEYAHWITDNTLRLLIRLARYKFVARLLRPGDDVLEIGSGSGLGAIFLAQHARHVTGIDVKPFELDEARSICRRDNVRFEQADFFDYPADRRHDLIVALDVIEHMPPDLGRRLVATAARHLAPGGLLVLGTPSVYSYPYQGPLSQASHVHCYDQRELVNLVEETFHRALPFGMNDEVLHTGHPKMTWYYFIIATTPR